MAQFIKNRWLKIITITAAAFLLLIAVTVVSLQLPAVQTKLIHFLTNHVSEKTGYAITIERISIQWLDRFSADKMEIRDLEKNLMIRANDVTIDYELGALFGTSTKVIEFVEINEAEVNARVINFDDSLQNLNLTEFINRLRELNTRQAKEQTPFVVVEEVALKNSVFTYMDYRKDTVISGFNYNKFRVENINTRVDELYAHADTLQMQIRSFEAHEPDNDLPIHSITGQFRLSKKALEFNGIDIHLGKSIIRDSVVLSFDSPRDLQSFSEKVDLNAHFKDALIHTEDLALFVPALKTLEDEYRLSGNFSGSVNNFSLTDATLAIGSATRLRGNIRMEGLPNIEETFMNYKLRESYVLIKDLEPYLKGTTFERLEPLHHLNFDGQLIGFVNDFVANGIFDTRMGRIQSDINLKITEDINNSVYDGKLSLYDFDLGAYAEREDLNKVTLSGKIKGKGITLENADFNLEGHIEKFDFRNYTYKNAVTNGHFRNRFFEGKFEIKDPNVQISLSGAIDLQNSAEKFLVDTEVKKLNLKPLHLSSKDISITGKAVVNASGLTIDSIFGEGIISDALVKVDNKSLAIDSLNFYSRRIEGEREIFIDSDLVGVRLSGKFNPTDAYDNIRLMVGEYGMAVENNNEKLNHYYENKDLSYLEDYQVDFNIMVKDFNPLLNLINDSIYISSGTSIKGGITGGYTSIVTLDMKSDSIRYRNNAFKGTMAEVSISKLADRKDILAMIYFNSEQQDLGNVLKTEELQFESIWDNSHIDFEFFLKQQNVTNYSSINGNVDFIEDNVIVKFHDSDIHLFEKDWSISSDNLIRFSSGEVSIENLQLGQDHQKISLNGKISRIPGNSLNIKIDSIELYNMNPVLRKPVDGMVNGLITLADAYDDLKLNVVAAIKNFKVDDILIGHVSGSTFYRDQDKKSDITLVVEREGIITASVMGIFKPEEPEDQLDLKARVNKAPLNILGPFLESYFNKFKGTTSGEFRLTGTFLKPVFQGDGIIENAGLGINYLKTNYSIDGNFSLAKNIIDFKDLEIRDQENNAGTLTGTITHDFFNRFALDLKGTVSNFLLLNTTSKDNDLFYGIGYGTGNISFKGPVNNLTIDAHARTDAGTRIFVPIGESSEVQKEDFINFVSFSDSLNVKEDIPIKNTELAGITLNLALDVTPDAYTEIIFDIIAGDIIRGRGEGDLRLQIDPSGEFNMFGDFYISQGGYNFTLYNIVNKEFQILPNSRISWYGDPYQGQMDIKATYEQLASLRPVIPQVDNMEIKDIPVEIKRKYPSKVLMNLNGPLLTPSIDFNIEVENLPNYQVTLDDGTPIEMNFLFSRFKDSWDEQELNRQVFSLIVLRKFSPLQSFSTGGTIASSVSELLSNQLSYWITQVDENLEIDVDLGSLDEEAFNTFQLRLSYTMLDGRLRIIRDGGFTNPYDNSSTKVPGFIGDWTVEYLLTPDGKLRVKMYNRTNYNTLDVNNQNSVLTAGFSVQHIQSFDELRDLFKKSKKEEKTEPDSVLNNKGATIHEDEVL